MKIVGVIQARTGSTRLPGKVLRPLGGRPVLQRMLERVRAARGLDEIVIATTRQDLDDPIRDLANRLDVRCVSGETYDLVDRHLQAGRETGADAIAKIPSDCPLIDPRVIDEVVAAYRAHADSYVFVGNLHPPTWPDGNDVEIMRLDTLEVTWREANKTFQREHTTPFIWDQPDRFAALNVTWSTGRDLSATHRLTLDYEEDLQLLSAVWDALYVAGEPPFSVDAIVRFLDEHPAVHALNARYAGASWMTRHLHELVTMRPAANGTNNAKGANGAAAES